MSTADNANLDLLDGDREQLLFLGKKFFWVIYHQVDPMMIVFSWKKFFLGFTLRWKDLHSVLEKIFGEDPFTVS